MTITEAIFKQIMSHWTTGISVVTTGDSDNKQGFTVNSFASVSIDPLLISLSIAKSLYAGQILLRSQKFGVNILSADQQNFGKLFAGFTNVEDRFAGINTRISPNGSIILPDVLGWMDCRVYKTVDVGASILILGQVTDGEIVDDKSPLAYFHRQWGTFKPASE